MPDTTSSKSHWPNRAPRGLTSFWSICGCSMLLIIHQRKTHQTAKLCCNFFQKLEASHDPSWPVHRCLFLGSRQLGDWHGWAASPVWWIHGSRDSSPPVALTLWSEWPARRCSSKDQGISMDCVLFFVKAPGKDQVLHVLYFWYPCWKILAGEMSFWVCCTVVNRRTEANVAGSMEDSTIFNVCLCSFRMLSEYSQIWVFPCISKVTPLLPLLWQVVGSTSEAESTRASKEQATDAIMTIFTSMDSATCQVQGMGVWSVKQGVDSKCWHVVGACTGDAQHFTQSLPDACLYIQCIWVTSSFCNFVELKECQDPCHAYENRYYLILFVSQIWLIASMLASVEPPRMEVALSQRTSSQTCRAWHVCSKVLGGFTFGEEPTAE